MLKRRMDALPLNPVVLLVLDGNKKAAEFYRKKGFVFTGRKLEQKISGKKLQKPLCYGE